MLQIGVVSISISQNAHGKSSDMWTLRVVGLDEASHVVDTRLWPVTTSNTVYGVDDYGSDGSWTTRLSLI